ncbi:MAG: DUF2628 domain-containing protein [Alphaproteobacteria bacterium]
MGTKIFTVHTNSWSAAPDGDAILIKEGFCWPAFLFGPFWALWHGMWRTAIGLALLSGAVSGIGLVVGLAEAGDLTVSLGLQAAIGLWANDWRRHVLARRSMLERGTVAARRLRDAERRYLRRHMAGVA